MLGKKNYNAEFIKTETPHGQVQNIIYVHANHSLLLSSQLLLLTNMQFTRTGNVYTRSSVKLPVFKHH